MPEGAKRYELDAILQSAHRASSMIEQILTFSRTKPARQSITELKETLQTFETFIRRLLPEHINLEIEIKTPQTRVLANENMLHQALANLVINSRDAMPEGGTITITLSEAQITEKNAPFGQMHPGRWAVLEVRDTGTGIPEEVLPHIFEPFFTTKQQGTGLGLAQVYGIVTQHGGFIDVTSKEGHGTTTTIYLPVYEEAEDTITGVVMEDIPEGRGEKVLVVEDEQALAEMLARDLMGHGYVVEVAEDGRRALEMIERNGFSLVVTDLMMPEMGGMELVTALRKRWPEMKTIVITGYTTEEPVNYAETLQGVTILKKPFSLKQLRFEIARALGRVQ